MPKSIINNIIIFFLYSISHVVCALQLNLQAVNLADTLRLLAETSHQNMMISPNVIGQVTLHLENAKAENVLQLLLKTYGLGLWQQDNITYVAPQMELQQRAEAEVKWQSVQISMAPLHSRVWQIKYASAKSVGILLQNANTSLISKRGLLQVDVRTNKVAVTDVDHVLLEVGKLIKQLDVPVRQVIIEARLASVDSDFEQALGVGFNQSHHAVGQAALSKMPGQYRIAVAKLLDGSLLDIQLSALENAGHAQLISSPTLFTADQQTASIEAGESIPYQASSEGGGTTTVFKKAVLGLSVTPHLLPGNKIVLSLQITQDRPTSQLIQGVPAISTHQIVTNVVVPAGRTIVLGGIYETTDDKLQARIPFISQVPVVGWMFKQQHVRRTRRELLIFVTPKIVV